MSNPNPVDFLAVYANFHQAISDIDCGKKCAAYNQHGVPFCCDTRHAVPSAYTLEWEYLRTHTDLWHLWQARKEKETDRLLAQTPKGQVLIECKGYTDCQRQFRSLSCWAFPFFPYITVKGEFIGISYYWEYEDRCWVISHLEQVTSNYIQEFVAVYEIIFKAYPEEKEAFRYHSSMMRRLFSRWKRAIPLLHRNGGVYKISPGTGSKRKISVHSLPKFGSYRIAAKLVFPDEV
jgi:hypothetical protein